MSGETKVSARRRRFRHSFVDGPSRWIAAVERAKRQGRALLDVWEARRALADRGEAEFPAEDQRRLRRAMERQARHLQRLRQL